MVTLKSFLAPSATLMIIEGKQLELEDPFDTASWGFIPTSTKNMRFINLSSTIEHIGIDIL